MKLKKKIIALDFGLKRTGIAISDETQTIAMGLTTIDSEKLIPFLNELTVTESIRTIVLGYPKNLNNSPTDITENVVELKKKLEKHFPMIEIALQDERFTSKMATDAIRMSGLKKKQRQDKKLIDKVSATIILQSYLSQV